MKEKETIYEIPLNDAFADNHACPICRLYAQLEHNELERILGAAMMEPSVRIETNKQGFCGCHLDKMKDMQKQLAIALIFESRLDEIIKDLNGKNRHPAAGDCYICNRIKTYGKTMIQNLFYLYQTSAEFTYKFNSCEGFCLPHFEKLLRCSEKELPKKAKAQFQVVLKQIEEGYLKKVKEDISDYCRQFEYNRTEPVKNPLAVDDAITLFKGK